MPQRKPLAFNADGSPEEMTPGDTVSSDHLPAQGEGGTAPVFAYAFYTANAAIAQGDIIDGANLRTVPGVGPEQYAIAAAGNAPIVAFPVVVGTPLAGTWKALQDMPSYAQLSVPLGANANAASGLFLKVT